MNLNELEKIINSAFEDKKNISENSDKNFRCNIRNNRIN